jgi:hypothetical protein
MAELEPSKANVRAAALVASVVGLGEAVEISLTWASGTLSAGLAHPTASASASKAIKGLGFIMILDTFVDLDRGALCQACSLRSFCQKIGMKSKAKCETQADIRYDWGRKR